MLTFPAHCTNRETEASLNWESPPLWLESKTNFDPGFPRPLASRASEPCPTGVGTALSCSKQACTLADKERPKLVLQLEVFGLDVRGTSQQRKLCAATGQVSAWSEVWRGGPCQSWLWT